MPKRTALLRLLGRADPPWFWVVPGATAPGRPGRSTTTAAALATVAAALATVAAATAASVAVAVVATGRPILVERWRLLWWLAAWGAAWVVAVVGVFRLPRRMAVPVVLVAATVVRLGALAGQPRTSDDLYRYAWDGRVQAAGIDPYRYAPSAPQLSALRERWLWPDPSGCAALRRPPGCTRMNRPDQRTIYPPIAEAWFAGVYRLAGIGARHKAWQVAGLVVDLITVVLLIVALRRWDRDPRWAAVYALCPAPVLELVGNGHVDGLAIAFMVAALVVAGPPPPRSATAHRGSRDLARDVAVGALIGAAALVKVYPALMLLALVGLRRTRPWLSVIRASAAAGLFVAVAYGPHLVAAGGKVLGYLPGYLKEEHYDSGSRFLLAGMLGLHGAAATAATAAALAAVVAWAFLRKPDLPQGSVVLFGALLLATTPVQPWYAVSLVALASMANRPHWTAVAAAGYPYYFAVILDSRHTLAIGRAAYGAALCIVVAGWLATGRGRPRSGTDGGGRLRRPAELQR